MSRVRVKFPVDAAPAPAAAAASALKMGLGGRAEMRNSRSSAFTEALRLHNTSGGANFGERGDGKVDRVELIVMDGSMSSVKRLRELSSSAEEERGERWEVVEEAAEKCYFKVVLWGELATRWTTDAAPPRDEVAVVAGLDQDASRSRLRRGDVSGYPPEERSTMVEDALDNTEESFLLASKLTRPLPTATAFPAFLPPTQPLFAPETSFVYRTSNSLVPNPPILPLLSTPPLPLLLLSNPTRRSRLGTGFPPLRREKVSLVAQASTANESNIELCYRTQILNKEDGGETLIKTLQSSI